MVSMSQYDFDEWADLDLARDDLNAVAKALPDKDFAVRILVDPEATKLKAEISSFFGQCARKGDRLFFYFAGHGYSERRRLAASESASAFLIARDTPYPTQQPQHGSGRNPPMEDTAVSVEELVQKARRSVAADVLIVLDACHVAAAAAGVRISSPNYNTPGRASCTADVPGNSLRARTSRQLGARNIITSGYGSAKVAANRAFGMAFAEGLGGGHADGYVSDFNPDGIPDEKVDAKELVNFVHDRIQIEVARAQTPQILCVGERLFAFAISDS